MEHAWNEGDVVVNGVRLHYTRTGGRLPPLVLAHGFSDSGMCWLPTALELSKDYDVILPDARGHGKSDRVNDAIPLDLAGDLAGVITGLGLPSPVLGGHSMGASTAAQVAAQHPGLLRGLILEDPAWFFLKPGETPPQHRDPDPYRTWLASLSGQPVEAVMAKCRQDSPTWGEIELRPWAESKLAFDPHFMIQRGALPSTPWQDVAKAIRCPTLLITADNGRGAIVTPDAVALATSLNPLIQVAAIPGAGHNIRREAFPAYIAAVKAFLARL